MDRGSRRERWGWIKAILLAAVLALGVRLFLFETITIHQSSMYPNFQESDRVVIGKMVYRFREPARGDVAVFETDLMEMPLIKRAIGLPGETVQIYDNAVYIDGERLTEPYLYQTMYDEYGPETVPADCVFFLGDNRNNSEDSRYPGIGMIPYGSIRGKVRLRIWPIYRIGWVGNPYEE